ncbi:MAG: hypothetical protein CMC37_02040 [Flavobacteriaceae bacterium]|nr:hypothetical protein [Flavobacteriaceae bacterium]|tara:strand:- start:13 stop:513 length:501 start_codon:yes stop_codon:yes gene_type:complete
MNNKKFLNREIVILLFIIIAAVIRLIPHPPNFAPITAMALFSGLNFQNKKLAYAIPILAMIVSDLFLGFYSISIFVYLSFIAITYIGTTIKSINVSNIFLSSLLFFIITNLGVWILGYPMTIEGLLTCFTLALPFFGYALAGDLFFSLLFKYGFKSVEKKYLIHSN